MPTRILPPLGRYGVALGATLMALLLRLLMRRWVWLDEGAGTFIFFAPAVMISAWYGGFGPGLFSTIAGALLGDYFLAKPTHQFSQDFTDWAKAIVFLCVGVQISWLCGALFAAKGRAEDDAKAARASEQLYRTLASNFPDGGVFLFDRDLRFTLAEGAGLSAAGLGRRELEGRLLWDVLPPEAHALARPLFRDALDGRPAVAEVPFRGRTYQVQTIPLKGAVLKGVVGPGVMAITQDVTERVQARETLQKAHDELEDRVEQRTAELNFQKTLMECQSESSADGILFVSNDSQVVFFNRRLLDLWQISEQTLSKPLEAVRAAMQRKLELADLQDPLRDRGTAAAYTAMDGERRAQLVLEEGRLLERYSAPVRSQDGTSYGRVWFFRDVTERKRLEKEILEVGERERQRIGQDLHDDLCQQLAGIACLGRVLWQRLAAKGAVASSEAEDADRIIHLVQQAATRARDLAKGLQPVTLQADGLATALAELAAKVESIFHVACLFRCQTPVSLEDAAAPTHLYRIAQEAINNAIKHGRAQLITIDLMAVKDLVLLAVEDDGVGIPEVPPAGSGQGMGLHVMNHRAKMIGATLTIERGRRGGTLVTCSLRAKPAPEKSERAAGGVNGPAALAVG